MCKKNWPEQSKRGRVQQVNKESLTLRVIKQVMTWTEEERFWKKYLLGASLGLWENNGGNFNPRGTRYRLGAGENTVRNFWPPTLCCTEKCLRVLGDMCYLTDTHSKIRYLCAGRGTRRIGGSGCEKLTPGNQIFFYYNRCLGNDEWTNAITSTHTESTNYNGRNV